jgi:hypothetical protein
MKRPTFAQRPWLGASALLLATHCGSPQTPAVTAPPPRPPAQAAPVIDTSPVPVPEELLALVRFSSLAPLAERVGQLTGLGAQVGPFVDQMLEEALDYPALAALVDRQSPVDLSVVLSNDSGQYGTVVSFAAPPLDDLENRLGQSFSVVAGRDGLHRLQPLPSTRPNDRGSQPVRCVVAPTPRATQSRVVCGNRMAAVERMAPYLARTLTLQEPAPHTVSVDLTVETLRRRFGADADEGLAQASAGLEEALTDGATGIWRAPEVRTVAVRLLRELIENARSVVNDSTALSTTLQFGEDRAVWRWNFEARNPSGTLLRGMSAALRGPQSATQEMLAHLLPDATVYFAATADSRPLEAFNGLLVELAGAMAQYDGRLNAADTAAVRQALQAVTVLDRETTAMALGYDAQGSAWVVSTTHYDTESTAQRAASGWRSLVSAARRPAVARWISSVATRINLPIDARELRELPTRGLPSGAVAVRLPALPQDAELAGAFSSLLGLAPPPAALAGSSARGSRPAPRRRPLEMILVPSGNDLVMAVGVDARALLTRYQGNSTPGLEGSFLSAPEGAIAMAVVPAGLPNAMRISAPQEAQEMSQRIARMPDQGRTPLLLRMGAAQNDDRTRYSLEIEVRAATLSALPVLLQ